MFDSDLATTVAIPAVVLGLVAVVILLERGRQRRRARQLVPENLYVEPEKTAPVDQQTAGLAVSGLGSPFLGMAITPRASRPVQTDIPPQHVVDVEPVDLTPTTRRGENTLTPATVLDPARVAELTEIERRDEAAAEAALQARDLEQATLAAMRDELAEPPPSQAEKVVTQALTEAEHQDARPAMYADPVNPRPNQFVTVDAQEAAAILAGDPLPSTPQASPAPTSSISPPESSPSPKKSRRSPKNSSTAAGTASTASSTLATARKLLDSTPSPVSTSTSASSPAPSGSAPKPRKSSGRRTVPVATPSAATTTPTSSGSGLTPSTPQVRAPRRGRKVTA